MDRSSFVYIRLCIIDRGFALLSLLLGAVGIYGVTAYGVARRSAEVGVRMALGASSTSVSRLILGDGMRRLALGLVIGTVLAHVLARAMRGLLFDVSPTDPITLDWSRVYWWCSV